MKTGTLITIVVLAAASVAGAVWIFKGDNPKVTPTDPNSATTATSTATPSGTAPNNEANPCPPLPAAGEEPPQIELTETEYHFGKMEAFAQKSHTFVIKNVGKGPLLIKKGEVTCKCTTSEVEEKPIAPGKSIDVTLSWHPLLRMEEFQQSAHFCTNDPKNRRLVFTVKGDVVERLSVLPRDVWNIGEVLDGKSAKVYGRVYSMTLDKFNIKKVTVENTKAIKATWKKFEKEQLEELKDQKAKCGYLIEVEAAADVPAGSFSFPLKIETDVKEARSDGMEGPEVTINLEVTGSRSGPFTFMSGSNSNKDANWIGEKKLIALGEFRALDGGEREISFFVRNCPKEGLKFLDQKCETCDSKALKVAIEPDEAVKSKAKRYKLKITYPPGPDNNPKNEGGNVGCRIRVKTNHPDAPDFDLLMYYRPY